MSRIFLSHSSKDNFAAVAIGDWLKCEGWDDVFLDLDPVQGIAPGERWEAELYRQASECEAVLFLVSQNWLASDWCRREYELTRKLNKRPFIVLIEDIAIDALPAFLRDTHQAVRLGAGTDHTVFNPRMPITHEKGHVTFSAEGLARLRTGLAGAGLDPKFFFWPPADEPSRAPYRGLEPFEARDAGVFFGRDAPVIEALDSLRGLSEAAPPRVFVILGASGAGKSSFLRAGLLPRLSRDDAHFVCLPPIRPERAAVTGASGLVAALASAAEKAGLGLSRAQISEAAETRELRPVLRQLLRGDAWRRIVFAIDQAEELFRAEGAAEGLRLLQLLGDLARSDDPPAVILFAIRSDSYDALQHAQPLAGLSQKPFSLPPMPRGAYQTVIERPAQRLEQVGRKLSIDPALTQTLLGDIEQGGGDALPLLAFTLEQLYRDHVGAGRISLDDYKKFGGLKGVIDAALARVFVEADKDTRLPKDETARMTLLRRGLIPWLAGVDPDTKTPRRRVARASQIPAETRPLLDLLVEQRLLTKGVEPASGESTIEPAHEALLRQWSDLKGWLEEDFGLLATLEGVQRAARDWDTNARAEAWAAHGGARLEEADRLDARPDIAAKLEPSDREYLAACREKEKTAREQARALAAAEKRAAHRTRMGLLVAIGLALIAMIAGLYAQSEKTLAEVKSSIAEAKTSEAETQGAIALRNQSAALTALSEIAIATYPTKAAKLALAAWPQASWKERKGLDGTLDALSAATIELREKQILRGHEKPLTGAAFSPDGANVVTTSWDGTARLWDTETSTAIAVLKGQDEGEDNVVFCSAFSPDGFQVVTASWDGTARLWNAKTGEFLAVLRGHGDLVLSAAFSSDSDRVVTASHDRTARVWDVKTGKEIAVLRGHGNRLNKAVFSPHGESVLTASDDFTARLWDARTGKGIAVLKGHDNLVTDASFSPDGTHVVTAGSDGTARLWDANTGKELAVLRGHEGGISRAAFSPDSSRIVTASEDHTARLWDAKTGKELAVLRGHKENVGSAVFSPDGARILTASDDHTARLWEANIGKELAVLRGHTDKSVSAVFSYDGAKIVTASDDRTARIWDANRAEEVAVLRGHRNEVREAMFSPDGQRVVTASVDRTARLWDASSGKELAVLRGHESDVNDAAFSSNGNRVVTASYDGTARLWDVTTGKELAVLRGHEGGVLRAAFSPDNSRIVTASEDHTARLWDAKTGKSLAVLRGHQSTVFRAKFSPDGRRVVTGSFDGTARLWGADAGELIAILSGHTAKIWDVAFSPDGALIVTASYDNTARLWDVSTGKEIAVLRGHDDLVSHDATNGVLAAAFSPDSRRVVTAGYDRTARLWDARTGKQIAVLRGHKSRIFRAAFSPDGQRVLTTSMETATRLWDATTGREIAIFPHSNPIEGSIGASFSPNGKRLVTIPFDNTVRIWNISSIPPGNLFMVACALLPDHDLTDIANDYGLTNLQPICEGDPPLPYPQ